MRGPRIRKRIATTAILLPLSIWMIIDGLVAVVRGHFDLNKFRDSDLRDWGEASGMMGSLAGLIWLGFGALLLIYLRKYVWSQTKRTRRG